MPKTKPTPKPKSQLTQKQHDELIATLKSRFEKNMDRHKGIKWADVHSRLRSKPAALAKLHQMETTGGEPDVVGKDKKSGEFIFYDCSAESPKGRRSLCYDRAALDALKEHKPKNSAVEMANAMGIAILSEEQYRNLQKLGEFDLKTSSWLKTPDAIRKLGGAIFGDRRFDTVFIYHNGAESYYAGRGFRGAVRV